MTKQEHGKKHHHSSGPKPAPARAPRSLALLLCLGALAGVLIWAKLRLVTDIPRSAYADPRDRQVIDDPGDDPADRVEDQERPEPEGATPGTGETPDSPSPRP